MEKCNWDPSKHGGKPCPVHGNGGSEDKEGNHKVKIEGGKYKLKYDDNSDWEDTDEETFNHVRVNAKADFDLNDEKEDFGFDEEESEEDKLWDKYEKGEITDKERENLNSERQKNLIGEDEENGISSYRKEKDESGEEEHIVITSGPHAGERYDNIEDYKNSIRSEKSVKEEDKQISDEEVLKNSRFSLFDYTSDEEDEQIAETVANKKNIDKDRVLKAIRNKKEKFRNGETDKYGREIDFNDLKEYIDGTNKYDKFGEEDIYKTDENGEVLVPYEYKDAIKRKLKEAGYNVDKSIGENEYKSEWLRKQDFESRLEKYNKNLDRNIKNLQRDMDNILSYINYGNKEYYDERGYKSYSGREKAVPEDIKRLRGHVDKIEETLVNKIRKEKYASDKVRAILGDIYLIKNIIDDEYRNRHK